MTKKFSLLQLFSIVDGRLSTDIGDVYDMLNHICDDNLMTHHLPTAISYLQKKNPKWFQELSNRLDIVKKMDREGDFELILSHLKKSNEIFDIPQLKDECDTSDFGSYMVENSLLSKIGSKA